VFGADRIMAQGEPDPATLPGVRVIVGIDQAAARADVDQAVTTMTWMIAVTLLAAVLIAMLGAIRYIRAPLGVLRAAALRWRDGDRATRVRLPGRSEIAALGRVFDEMADATERGERPSPISCRTTSSSARRSSASIERPAVASASWDRSRP